MGGGKIGYGHTEGVKKGDKISADQADALLMHDLAIFQRGVNRAVNVPLTQGQFDALVSFAYNVGLDEDTDTKAEGLGDSTLLRKLNAGDYPGAQAEFPKWNKDNGRVVAGLTRRRLAEQTMFM